MFVDTGLLRAGAQGAERAGEHTHQAAQRLSRESLVPQMFGDFAAAEAFHHATESAHAQHVRLLLVHTDTLTAVGKNAHRSAAGFTEMEEGNARSVRAVRCTSTT